MSVTFTEIKERIVQDSFIKTNALHKTLVSYIQSLQLQPKDVLENYNVANYDGAGCRIDLHGYSVQKSKEYVIDMVKKTHSNDNYALIHVITGRGNHINSSGARGVLFESLQKWIKDPQISDLVKEVKKEQGAYLLILNKEPKISTEKPLYQLKESILRGFANTGNKDAQCELGKRLFAKNNKESQGWFLKAAQQGDFEAMQMLGYCHAMGRCAQYSPQAAMKWYARAAVGDAAACNNLGMMHFSGEAGKVDYQQAIYWYKRGEKLGNVQSQRFLGIISYKLGRYEEAFVWNDKASANNDHPAQVNLGCMYQQGLGVAKNEKKAVELFRSAATAGIAEGKMRLGLAYINGIGCDKEYKEAAKLFLEVGLSNQDTVGSDCQFLLYKMYKEGLGFTPNRQIAERWLQRAVNNNNRDALAELKLRNTIEINELDELVSCFGVPAASLEAGLRALENESDCMENKEPINVASQLFSISNALPVKTESKDLHKKESANIKVAKTLQKNTGYCPCFSRYILLSGAMVATAAISEYVRRNYGSSV